MVQDESVTNFTEVRQHVVEKDLAGYHDPVMADVNREELHI